MKAIIYGVIIAISLPFIQAQITADVAKNNLQKIINEYDVQKVNCDSAKTVLDSLKNAIQINSSINISSKISTSLETAQTQCKKLDSIYNSFTNAITFFKSNKVNEKVLDSFNIKNHQSLELVSSEAKKPKVMWYFGEDVVLEDKKIFTGENSDTQNKVLEKVLGIKSEAYLGNFRIPQLNQKIEGYKVIDNDTISKQIFQFQKIRIELIEGAIDDVQVWVKDSEDNTLIFQNRVPISLLKMLKNGRRNSLEFSELASGDKNNIIQPKYKSYENIKIRLSDAIIYIPNPGQNFVPDDENFTFPRLVDEVEENKDAPIVYKIIQNTSLQNLLEFRTYSDFLALLGQGNNGLVQIEADGKFYIAPFNIPNTSIYIFKSVIPFVHFSRFDDEDKNLSFSTIGGVNTLSNTLEILEKAYLQMGFNLDLFSFKFQKEFPFNVNFYLPVQYNISNLDLNTEMGNDDFKSFGMGLGTRFEFKRVHNFRFTFQSEVMQYNNKEFNDYKDLEFESYFQSFNNSVELKYFPSGNKSQSIFLRYRTFNNIDKDNRESFYQIQFGYQFSIGLNKIKQ